MVERSSSQSNEGRKPEPEASSQVPKQPSQIPPAWAPPKPYVAPGMASPEHPAGPQEQSYGQPGEPGQISVSAEPGPPPLPPRHSRRRMVIVIVTAIVVLAGAGTGLAVELSGSGQPKATVGATLGGARSKSAARVGILRLPAALLGFARNTSPAAQWETGGLAKMMTSGGFKGLISNSAAALYGPGGGHGVVVAVGRWSDAAKAARFVSSPRAQVLSLLKINGVEGAALFPAGPLGGGLACGHTPSGSEPVTTCAWMDTKMLGIVILDSSVSTLSDAAARTIQARSAIER